MAAQMAREEQERYNALLTGEDLLSMTDVEHTELIEGRLMQMSPTGFPHGIVEITIGSLLKAFVHPQKLGMVFGGEVGIYTKRNPDSIRAADVAFISRARYAQLRVSKGYLDVAPELVVEVLSPDDYWEQTMQKMGEYFSAGVQSVWVVAPLLQEIYVYHSLTDAQRFTMGDTLTDEAVLQGFTASVEEIFDLGFDDEESEAA